MTPRRLSRKRVHSGFPSMVKALISNNKELISDGMPDPGRDTFGCS